MRLVPIGTSGIATSGDSTIRSPVAGLDGERTLTRPQSDPRTAHVRAAGGPLDNTGPASAIGQDGEGRVDKLRGLPQTVLRLDPNRSTCPRELARVNGAHVRLPSVRRSDRVAWTFLDGTVARRCARNAYRLFLPHQETGKVAAHPTALASLYLVCHFVR